MATTLQESCINKLLLVCFCLDVPVCETLQPLAFLMRKRILPDNIMEIANLVNQRFLDYRRTSSRALELSCETLQEKKTSLDGANPHLERKVVYPKTIAQLEKKLDELLGCFCAKQSHAWRRLAAAGLIERLPASVNPPR